MKSVALAILFPSITWALQSAFLWPIPQTIVSGNIDLYMDKSFKIHAPASPVVLRDAVKRYMKIIQTEHWSPVQTVVDPVLTTKADSTLSSLEVVVHNKNDDLVPGADESYTLNIQESGAVLTATTVWGAIRGLETFSQLVLAHHSSDKITDIHDSEDADNEDHHRVDLYIPETPIYIRDAPVYPHRGLMLDTARNYFPVKDILRTIDALAYSKMNVLHWHITDSQSFPLRLASVPELAQHGAYVLNQKRLVYTKNDVKQIVNYARARGVRVIPEIDMPAHTGSWAMSHKEIITCSDKFWLDATNEWDGRLAAEPTTGQLNPVLDDTYTVVDKVIGEVASLFPDAYYHGGGDEPVYKCWEDSEDVRNYMKEYNATGSDLLNIFLEKEVHFIKNAGKIPILWEDSVTSKDLPIPKDVVLQIWNSPLQIAAKKGYKVIASNSNFWYLDCGHGGWSGNDNSYDEQERPAVPEEVEQVLNKYGLADNYNPGNWGGSGGDWCSPFKTWQRIYQYDIAFNLTQEEAKNVLGGEVALWTEQTDATSIDGRLWPRASAAAEVLWSGRYDAQNHPRGLSNAMNRIFDWRYRLVKRGIKAEALQPLWWQVYTYSMLNFFHDKLKIICF
ncbi:glycoside hydrolase superfamily [Dichotomocladium elegans]|nr:glycoside hydrolase superfamily [Dichotomocladium elegans]